VFRKSMILFHASAVASGRYAFAFVSFMNPCPAPS